MKRILKNERKSKLYEENMLRRYEDEMNKEIFLYLIKNGLHEIEISLQKRRGSKKLGKMCTYVEKGHGTNRRWISHCERREESVRTKSSAHFVFCSIVHYDGMMIENGIKIKIYWKQKHLTKFCRMQENGKEEEKKYWNLRHLKGQSRFMIYRRINKKNYLSVWQRFCVFRAPDAFKADGKRICVYQKCEPGKVRKLTLAHARIPPFFYFRRVFLLNLYFTHAHAHAHLFA